MCIIFHNVPNLLLQIETDILLLMSALLVVIVLLPMIPSLISPHLNEIFDVFRFVSYMCLGLGTHFLKLSP